MPYLAFNLNDGNEFVFDILEERLSIGREASNDIVIDNTFISSHHAEFIRQPDGSYEIVDLKSSNGTFVNGRRVERFRVKGGDRIMFGQLESRFRERAPKGLASDGGSKSVSVAKGQPSREDGKKGDTESIPARDKGDLPKSTPETGKIEVTKPVVQRSHTDTPRPPGGSAPPPSLIPKPSAFSPPAPSRLAVESEKLRQQRDSMPAENDGEQNKREEIRLLDATLEMRRKELCQTQAEITGFKSELEKLRGQVQGARAGVESAKTEAGRLDARRRDLSNTESKLESTRALVAKAEEDLSTAQKSLQALHAEADKQRKDRETAIAKLAAEEAAAKEKVAAINQMLATAQKSEADLKSQRSRELQTLDAQLAAKATELAKAQTDLTQVLGNLTAQQAVLGKTTEEAQFRESTLAKLAADEAASAQKLAVLQQQAAAADAEVKRLVSLQADTHKSEAEHQIKRSGELLKLDQQLEAKIAELKKTQADLAIAQNDLIAQQGVLKQTAEDAKARETAVARLAADEAAATQKLAGLQKQISDADAEVKRLTALQADAQKSEAEQLTKRSADLQDLDKQLDVRRTALAELETQRETKKNEIEAAMAALLGRQQSHEADVSTAEQRQADLDTQIAARGARLVEVQRQVKELEDKAADLTNKLDDLALTDSKLSDAAAALKAVESRKAEVLATVSALTKDRDERTRELLAATEHGRAQTLLTQKLVQRREAVENEVHLIEQQQTELSQAMGRLREQVRVVEAELKERESTLAAAGQRTQNLEDLAAKADLQLKALQAEHEKVTEQLALAKTDLEQSVAAASEKKKDAAAAAAAAEKSSQQQVMLAEKVISLEAVIASLTTTHASTQQKLSAAESEHQNLQDRLAARQKEISGAEARMAELTQQTAGLDARLKELAAADKQNAELKASIATATQERDKLLAETQRLAKERADLESVLPDLRGNVTQTRAEADNLKAELAGLIKDRDAAAAKLKESLAQRHASETAVEALRIESVDLDKALEDRRAKLEAETNARLAEVNAAEARLKGADERIAVAEKRLAELAEVDARLATATKILKDTEAQRQAEEKTLAELARSQDRLKKDCVALEASLKTENAKLEELTKAVITNEGKALEAEKRTDKAVAAQQAAEHKRIEADAAAEKARAEEKNLRKQIPALTTEMAGIQAMLVTVTKEREEASQFVTRLNVTTDGQNKKLAELQQQISQLEEAHKVREERVMKAQEEVDKEYARLKAAQEQFRAAEAQLGELEKEIKEAKMKADAAKKDAAAIEGELRQRLDRVQNLKADEERLLKVIETQKSELAEVDMTHKELHAKIETRKNELGELIQVGGKILDLGQALAGLESRQTEINQSLRKASEEDLAIQVKLNAAQEALNRESARAEQARKDRDAAEAEFKKFSGEIQKQAAVLQNYELEQKKRIAELEKRIAALGTTQQRAEGQINETKAELVRLEGKKQEFAQAEAQLRHWQDIEKRLQGQLVELEEKHEIMRRGLPTEESTVVMFANDIIKRIDLIDALVARYAGSNGSDVPQQLITLRASVEDILHQHGVTEFDVPNGTEVDIELRRRIAVVDSLPGKSKPRVIESCRSGFIFSRGEGHEIILRKVEVRTSSQ